ncbi:hypothetical protein [Crenothrix polyspora]|uniref:Cytochrome c domain-containing protein n=1 Tax=Crenothrix polyspora TaxID=360316 RepID=A0A1R4H2K3_9GAMM|nr:hypothetical protein [Crenothrix polyspora]SJM90461.1 exported hypothetical protein [Crenothrix polyspora]
MNKKILLSSVLTIATVGLSTSVWAHPVYMGPAHAVTCSDCHVGGTRSKKFVPGLIEQFPINQSLAIADKIKAIFKLSDAQRLPIWTALDKQINPKPISPDTAPVLKISATKFKVSVGGKALIIPLSVTDKEADTYTIDGPDLNPSKPSAFNGNHVSKFHFTWKVNEPEYAGQTFPIEISVKEDQRKTGRILKSNSVKAWITVMPKGK